MGYDIIIENSNTEGAICKPYLSVSSFNKPTYTITKILTVEDGYISRDKIITLELDDSYIDTSNSYPFNRNVEYVFQNSSKESQFYISNIAELSGNTTISVYGKESHLKNFFGTLTANAVLDSYIINYAGTLQFAEDEVELLPNSSIKNITKTSCTLFIDENPNSLTKTIVRYREYNTITDWTIIETTGVEVDITGLSSKTRYEVQFTLEYIYNNIPLYSDSSIVKTR